jgi:hypothetical protein
LAVITVDTIFNTRAVWLAQTGAFLMGCAGWELGGLVFDYRDKRKAVKLPGAVSDSVRMKESRSMNE